MLFCSRALPPGPSTFTCRKTLAATFETSEDTWTRRREQGELAGGGGASAWPPLGEGSPKRWFAAASTSLPAASKALLAAPSSKPSSTSCWSFGSRDCDPPCATAGAAMVGASPDPCPRLPRILATSSSVMAAGRFSPFTAEVMKYMNR